MYRAFIILLLYWILPLETEAQSIGPYSGFYFTTHHTGNQNDFDFGPIFGARSDFAKIKTIQLGIDAAHFSKTYNQLGNFYEEVRNGTKDTTIFGYTSYSRQYRASSFLLEVYFSNPTDDTFGIAVGLKGGVTYFVHRAIYGNPIFIDVNNPQVVPSIGGGGRFFRNYLFGLPLQLFAAVDLCSLYVKMDPEGVIDYSRPQRYPLVTFQGKIGMAYRF